MASSRLPRRVINTDSEITKPLSLVQQRARQFEALATLQVKSKECNWWLSDFKNLQENPCECEPCESSKSTDDGVIDSQKNVDVRENVDVQEENIFEECEDILQNDSLIDGNVKSEDDRIATGTDDDDDLVLANSPVNENFAEAMNDNVNFKPFTNIHHGETSAQSNDGEVNMTDED